MIVVPASGFSTGASVAGASVAGATGASVSMGAVVATGWVGAQAASSIVAITRKNSNFFIVPFLSSI